MSLKIPIKDLTPEEQSKIRKDLTFKFYNHFSEDYSTISIYNAYEGQVLLPFSYARMFLRDKGITSINFKSHHPCNSKFKGNFLENQVPVYNQALEILNSSGIVVLKLSTGFGKTFTAIALACALGLKTVVVTHSITLFSQWQKSLKDLVDGKGISIQMEKQINKLSLEEKKSFGCVIVDEVHEFFNERFSRVLEFVPKFMILLSATPEARGKGKMLEAIVGDLSTRMITTSAKKEIRVVQYLTSFEIKYKNNTRGKVDYNDFLMKLLLNEERNAVIVAIIQKILSNPENKMIVITSRVEHCKTLNSLLDQKQISSEVLIRSRKSKVTGTSRVLIGNYHKMGVGFDEKNFFSDLFDSGDGKLSNIVMIATSIKEPSLLEQIVGRSRVENPTIVHVINSDRLSSSHWRDNLKWYKKLKEPRTAVIDVKDLRTEAEEVHCVQTPNFMEEAKAILGMK